MSDEDNNMENIEHIRIKTFEVILSIFNGNMIETWAAYTTIYPNELGTVDPDALSSVKTIANKSYGYIA